MSADPYAGNYAFCWFCDTAVPRPLLVHGACPAHALVGRPVTGELVEHGCGDIDTRPTGHEKAAILGVDRTLLAKSNPAKGDGNAPPPSAIPADRLETIRIAAAEGDPACKAYLARYAA